MNSVPKLFSCCYADCWTENHFSTEFGVLAPNCTHSHTLFWGCVSRWFGRALAWHARGQRFDPAILHQKSTVLRRKYGAFLFAEADFWGLHCFACTVFGLLQAVPIQPPTFDVTLCSKKNVCRPGSQDILHLPFLCLHAHFFVEVLCRGVSCPDVQRHLIAALLFCLLLHIFKQAFSDVLSPCLMVSSFGAPSPAHSC